MVKLFELRSNIFGIAIFGANYGDSGHLHFFDSYDFTQAHNITVYAIGVGPNQQSSHLKMSANGGNSNKNVLTTASYENLKGTLTKLTQAISLTSSEGEHFITRKQN